MPNAGRPHARLRAAPAAADRLPPASFRPRSSPRLGCGSRDARHNRPRMKLFLPSARTTNWLLIVGFGSLGYALYMRYLAIENTTVGLACAAGLDTWLCFTRTIVIACTSIRSSAGPRSRLPRSICCAPRPSCSRSDLPPPASASCSTMSACRGSPSGYWCSASRVAHPNQSERKRGKRAAQPQRLPIGQAFVRHDIAAESASTSAPASSAAPRRPCGCGTVSVRRIGTIAAVSGAKGKSGNAGRIPGRARPTPPATASRS